MFSLAGVVAHDVSGPAVLVSFAIAIIASGAFFAVYGYDAMSAAILMAFVVVALGVLRLRRTRPDAERVFRTPWVPLVPLIGVGSSVWLMSYLGLITWIRFLAWLVLGLALHWGFGYRNSKLNRSQV